METEKDKKLRKDRNNFFIEIETWLKPLGFYHIYSNHPNNPIPRIDMIKSGIRVCSVKDKGEPYFYINTEVFLKDEGEILILKTGRYFIKDTEKLNKMFSTVKKNRSKLEKRSAMQFLILLFKKTK